jgi:hypothetical protein
MQVLIIHNRSRTAQESPKVERNTSFLRQRAEPGKLRNLFLNSIKAIVIKDKDELDGEPVGPVVLTTSKGEQVATPRWTTLRHARELAARRGVELERI